MQSPSGFLKSAFARSEALSRGDIQGLRAVAVLAVVADHVYGQPVGGFVGVDIFFVVSGFLITGVLLSGVEHRGRLSYADFYRRRARRLLPAATLVIVATVVASSMIFTQTRVRGIGEDGLWAFFFASNWHFAIAGTDYFAADGFTSPLQHYWSLAVEEQFYLVWPTVLVLALAGWRGRGLPSRGRLFIVTVLLSAGAFVYSLGHSESSPTWAYFSTLDRAWELGAGAALAVAAPQLERIPGALRPLLGWGGLATIVASLLVVTDERPFPAPWAALPVAGTLLVLAAGTGIRQQGYLVPLVNPVARYVGDISYSLYLWHFPVVILLAVRFPEEGTTYRVVAPALALGLSVLSYHFLEDPIRRSTWLEPNWKKRASGPRGARLASQWIAVSAVVTLLLVVTTLNPERPSNAQLLQASPGGKGAGGVTQAEYLSERIEQSLGLKSFPDLRPATADLGNDAFFASLVKHGCSNALPGDLERCRFGEPGATKLAVVTGDSYAMAYMGAVRAALEPRGYDVQQLTLQECPAWDIDRLKFDGSPYPECSQYRDFARQQIRSMHPDLLILSSSDKAAGTLASGATGQAAADELSIGIDRELKALRGAADRTVVLAPPPGSSALQTCQTRFSKPSDCVGEIQSYWYDVVGLEQGFADQYDADYIDTQGWFCVLTTCPAFVGNTPVFYDGSHLTWEFSNQLGPVLAEALFGVSGPGKRGSSGNGGRA